MDALSLANGFAGGQTEQVQGAERWRGQDARRPAGTEASVTDAMKLRARLRELRLRWHELPLRWDVDRPEDLERLRSDARFAALVDLHE